MQSLQLSFQRCTLMDQVAIIALFFSGVSCLTGREVRMVEEGRDAIFTCGYDHAYRNNVKFWCQGPHKDTCQVLLQSSSQQTTSVSIADDKSNNMFNVTMRNLQISDTNLYWCGISGSVHKKTPAGYLAVLHNANSLRASVHKLRGQEKGSVSVQCWYDPVDAAAVKYWCKGLDWWKCSFAKRTDTANLPTDRIFINDDQVQGLFTVTIRDLRVEDEDQYWCGVELKGDDRKAPVYLTVSKGTWRIVVRVKLITEGALDLNNATVAQTFLKLFDEKWQKKMGQYGIRHRWRVQADGRIFQKETDTASNGM